ncbi:MAG: ferredoxin [Bacteroidetes bacterium]|nr:MAG: ferredoxin [Bacteroidota bacterium]
MGIRLEVNGRVIDAEKGETILSALNRSGMHVPTICSMEGLSPSGACRMCVVELEGSENLVPSCSYPIEHDLKIFTHSPRVLKARKTNVELLLSNHPDDCLYCERNGSCELQTLAKDMNIRERRIPGKRSRHKIDNSSPAIIRDPAKCILCGRCVRVCEEVMATSTLDFAQRGNELHISTTLARPLNFSNCTACGQCLLSCPTGALVEHVQFPELENYIHAPGKVVVVQYTPAVTVSVAAQLGFKEGADISGLINTALRRYGFDFVFETALGAELMFLEQVKVFDERKKAGARFPLITSSCPAWVQYLEQYYPELLPHLSPLKSPAQINASLIREYLPAHVDLGGKELVSVLISSCTAAKTEARRVEMTRAGIPVIDVVMTARELTRLIRLSGLDLTSLQTEEPDKPFSTSGSAGKLTAVSGGEAEATVRSLYYSKCHEDISSPKLHRFRVHRPFREMTVKAGKEEIRMACVSGLKNAVDLLEDLMAGRKHCDLLEVMACPDGCVNGGGQPLSVGGNSRRTWTKAIYDADNAASLVAAHHSKAASMIYESYLGEPGSPQAKELLHTRFSKREVLR